MALWEDIPQPKLETLRDITCLWYTTKQLNDCATAVKKTWTLHRNSNGKLDAVDKKYFQL